MLSYRCLCLKRSAAATVRSWELESRASRNLREDLKLIAPKRPRTETRRGDAQQAAGRGQMTRLHSVLWVPGTRSAVRSAIGDLFHLGQGDEKRCCRLVLG